jgi:hypothetical protein
MPQGLVFELRLDKVATEVKFRVMEYTLEELSYLAKRTCVEIYDDFDSFEIKMEPKSVQLAWTYGAKIKELDRE